MDSLLEAIVDPSMSKLHGGGGGREGKFFILKSCCVSVPTTILGDPRVP